MTWAKNILEKGDLSSKMAPISLAAPIGKWTPYTLPVLPARDEQLKITEDRIKFPSQNAIITPRGRSIALHSFANHELLAIEMMAAAILIYPHEEDNKESVRMKRGLVTTIKDEQKHLGLYINRIKEDGVQFGDYPLNDFFWRQMPKLDTIDSFFALMSLTFESANLDFALQYEKIFREKGDIKTADIMKVVFEDEITHVALGAHWLNEWKNNKTLWEYYREMLPHPVTPARAKGPFFAPESRVEAGLDQDWIKSLENYSDNYRITSRKEWR
jgi:uncharacterized ferritin-like protein (DUF455 family)